MIRQVTLKVVYDALGIKRNKKGKSILARVDRVLHDLRKRFRLACTDGLGISDVYIPEFKGVETPLIDAYLTLSFSTFSLREYRAITMLSMDDSMKENDKGFQEIMETLKATKYLAFGIPQYSLSTRIAQRAKIFNERYKRYISCLKYIVHIRNAFDAAIHMSMGPQNKPQFSYNETNCSALRDAVHNFVVFDDKYMDKEIYAEMPRQLIKSLPIRDMLLQVCKMRIIHEFRKNDDILSAAREAGELLDRWRRRSKNCRTFYVVLSKPSA
ncbi:hypothetical protein HYPSUDRAFT_66228 [Hypholoma sublateritium FD-334 SS-4]|uniref:Uncharacterized protein n=1 Tax=Hypholoma sublateritium (strain FD-334 SS-4) TaxID=945553 RepID=A0A0D2MIQ0_HYPSF|nr:hypothetical protein HYPSUDRAFT_66228 [Hypholoma sublateritium FD-334 SS-4]